MRISWSTHCLVGLAAGDRERQHQVLLGGEDRQQVEELEDEAELVAAQLGQLAVVEAGDLDPVELDRAGGRLVEPGEDVHQRRLAGAGGAHDRGEAVALEGGADPGQGVDRRVALAVATGKVGGDHNLSVQTHFSPRGDRHRVLSRPNSLRRVALADDFDGFLIDLDGVVWIGREPVPGAPEALRALLGPASEIVFVTNNPGRPPAAYAERLRGWGSRSARSRSSRPAWSTARLAGRGRGGRRQRLRDRRARR